MPKTKFTDFNMVEFFYLAVSYKHKDMPEVDYIELRDKDGELFRGNTREEALVWLKRAKKLFAPKNIYIVREVTIRTVEKLI